MTAARAEKSSTVQRSYAQAAATVAKYSSEARVAKLVEEAVTMYTTPGDASSARPLLHPTQPLHHSLLTLPYLCHHSLISPPLHPTSISLHPLSCSAHAVLHITECKQCAVFVKRQEKAVGTLLAHQRLVKQEKANCILSGVSLPACIWCKKACVNLW